jgi:hypothetical protein
MGISWANLWLRILWILTEASELLSDSDFQKYGFVFI